MQHPPTLIVALDVSERDQALSLCESLEGMVGHFKVGSELFTAAGPGVVEEICRSGARVFLDLKFHDIPHTVSRAVAAACRWGAHLVDVHASGGKAMLEAAVAAARRAGGSSASQPKAKVFGVTVLTHLGDEDLGSIGIADTARQQVVRLARLAREAGLDGLVASAHEVRAVREATEDGLEVLVPGLRPKWAVAPHDQKRVATPADAARAGARYVVVGRAITTDPSPPDAARRVIEEIESA